MKKKRRARKPPRDLFVIHVGTAGIGRQRFRAYFADTCFDRSDDNDDNTFDTPGEALAALGKKMDFRLVSLAWMTLVDELEKKK